MNPLALLGRMDCGSHFTDVEDKSMWRPAVVGPFPSFVSYRPDILICFNNLRWYEFDVLFEIITPHQQ